MIPNQVCITKHRKVTYKTKQQNMRKIECCNSIHKYLQKTKQQQQKHKKNERPHIRNHQANTNLVEKLMDTNRKQQSKLTQLQQQEQK